MARGCADSGYDGRMSILVLHIPHASTYIPAEVRKEILLSGTELSNELLRMTDRYTDLLVSGVDSVSRVVFPVSRLVVDPERFEDDQVESMAHRGMGMIYTRASTGRPLRQVFADLLDHALVYKDLAGFLVLAVDAGIGELFHGGSPS